MSEQDPENTGNTAQDPAQDDPSSALRGTLGDNADGSELHDMGGGIGPADDTDSGRPRPRPDEE